MSSSSFASSVCLLALLGGLAASLQGCGGSSGRSTECGKDCVISTECSDGKKTTSYDGCEVKEAVTADDKDCESYDKAEKVYSDLSDDDKKADDKVHCAVAEGGGDSPSIDIIVCDGGCTISSDCGDGEKKVSYAKCKLTEPVTTPDDKCVAYDTDMKKKKAMSDAEKKAAEKVACEAAGDHGDSKDIDRIECVGSKCVISSECTDGETLTSYEDCNKITKSSKVGDENCAEYAKKKAASEKDKTADEKKQCEAAQETKPDGKTAAFLTSSADGLLDNSAKVTPESIEKPAQATVV